MAETNRLYGTGWPSRAGPLAFARASMKVEVDAETRSPDWPEGRAGWGAGPDDTPADRLLSAVQTSGTVSRARSFRVAFNLERESPSQTKALGWDRFNLKRSRSRARSFRVAFNLERESPSQTKALGRDRFNLKRSRPKKRSFMSGRPAGPEPADRCHRRYAGDSFVTPK